MASTVKGTARKGMRNTHGKKPLPSGAKSDHDVHGGSGGMGKGAENVHGSAGNAQKSGTP